MSVSFSRATAFIHRPCIRAALNLGAKKLNESMTKIGLARAPAPGARVESHEPTRIRQPPRDPEPEMQRYQQFRSLLSMRIHTATESKSLRSHYLAASWSDKVHGKRPCLRLIEFLRYRKIPAGDDGRAD